MKISKFLLSLAISISCGNSVNAANQDLCNYYLENSNNINTDELPNNQLLNTYNNDFEDSFNNYDFIAKDFLTNTNIFNKNVSSNTNNQKDTNSCIFNEINKILNFENNVPRINYNTNENNINNNDSSVLDNVMFLNKLNSSFFLHDTESLNISKYNLTENNLVQDAKGLNISKYDLTENTNNLLEIDSNKQSNTINNDLFNNNEFNIIITDNNNLSAKKRKSNANKKLLGRKKGMYHKRYAQLLALSKLSVEVFIRDKLNPLVREYHDAVKQKNFQKPKTIHTRIRYLFINFWLAKNPNAQLQNINVNQLLQKAEVKDFIYMIIQKAQKMFSKMNYPSMGKQTYIINQLSQLNYKSFVRNSLNPLAKQYADATTRQTKLKICKKIRRLFAQFWLAEHQKSKVRNLEKLLQTPKVKTFIRDRIQQAQEIYPNTTYPKIGSKQVQNKDKELDYIEINNI